MTIRTTFEELGNRSVTGYCRQLIKEGVNSRHKLEVYRNRKEPDLIVKTIGKGAKLMIRDDGRGDIRHVPYDPTSWDRMANEGHRV